MIHDISYPCFEGRFLFNVNFGSLRRGLGVVLGGEGKGIIMEETELYLLGSALVFQTSKSVRAACIQVQVPVPLLVFLLTVTYLGRKRTEGRSGQFS